MTVNAIKPSADKYKLKGQFKNDVEGTFTNGTNKEYSFGVSRKSMIPKGVHDTERQIRKGNASPGPGNYAEHRNFGKQGLSITFSPRLKVFNKTFVNEKGLPGPGTYDQRQQMNQSSTSNKINYV
jgi:hypothetical protein